jgi:hypothetical protein
VSREKRRALRILLNAPALVEAIEMPKVQLHDNLAAVYERVTPNQDKVGTRFDLTLRDLSTNGAFLAGEPVPLLSRVACTFDLEGYGRVEALGWVLWRRTDSCEVPRPNGDMVELPKGFGVLFEAIPLDARLAIHRMVSNAADGKN